MANLQPLKFTQVLPRAVHTATVIFIHGLGDSGAGWMPLAQQLSRDMPHVKWVLPNARMSPVTINGGMSCPSWFDIYTLGGSGLPTQEDEAGLLESVRSINEIVDREVDSGIPSERVLVGGFSQGAAVSLLTGLTSPRKLAGVCALSGWLPLRAKIGGMLGLYAKTLPIFMGHGTSDQVVMYAWGQASAKFLESELGIKSADAKKLTEGGMTFKSYRGMAHSACEEEFSDFHRWLKEILP